MISDETLLLVGVSAALWSIPLACVIFGAFAIYIRRNDRISTLLGVSGCAMLMVLLGLLAFDSSPETRFLLGGWALGNS